jgi:hypothetical protein
MKRVLTRGVMVALWCLVLWGTLWDLVLLHTWLTQGSSAALNVVLAPPLANAAAAWANRLCGLLAILAWALALGALWSSPGKAA